MEPVPQVCQNFCGAYLPGVVCKEIKALLEVVLTRDIAIAEKNLPELLYVKGCLFFFQLQLLILYKLYLQVNLCSVQPAITWYQAQSSH